MLIFFLYSSIMKFNCVTPKKIEKFGICGLEFTTTGQDPIDHEIRLITIAIPNNSVYIANCQERNILSDLARLLEDRRIKKVLYDALPALAFVRASLNRKLNACNIFDLMLASQICWSGYYYLTPSDSPKNPWKKRIPDHSWAENGSGRALEPESGPPNSRCTIPPARARGQTSSSW